MAHLAGVGGGGWSNAVLEDIIFFKVHTPHFRNMDNAVLAESLSNRYPECRNMTGGDVESAYKDVKKSHTYQVVFKKVSEISPKKVVERKVRMGLQPA